jgi:thioredoxin-like negative regulator of GroEL
MYLPLGAAPEETYTEAFQTASQNGQPMMVLVGAQWCPACQQMEKQTLPQMRERGLLKRVAFALVDVDREREIGRTLTAGGPIPQLILFRRTREGWSNNRLIGGQTIPTLEQFINEEVAASEADQKVLAKSAAPAAAAKSQIKPASLSKERANSKPAAKPAPAKQAGQASSDKKQTAANEQDSSNSG